MFTFGTNQRIAAEQKGHPLLESTVHGGANVHPLHKFVVCDELTLGLRPESDRCGRLEAELASRLVLKGVPTPPPFCLCINTPV